MLVRFLRLPHGFDLLEGNIHDQDKSLNIELEMLDVNWRPFIHAFPLDPIPPWEIYQSCKCQLATSSIKLGTLCRHQAHNHPWI
jgi:hypothetical protein